MRSLRSNWAAFAAIGLMEVVVNGSFAIDLGAWTDRSPTVLPPPARAPQMVFDEQSNSSVLFGGANNQGGLPPYGETWAWDGRDWNMINSNDPARANQGMTFDSIRRVVVLFGGSDETGFLGDTWEWGGAVWSLVHPGDPTGVTAPSGRDLPPMVYDEKEQSAPFCQAARYHHRAAHETTWRRCCDGMAVEAGMW